MTNSVGVGSCARQGRYKIMKAYMPKVGSMGLDMMFRTCTVQVGARPPAAGIGTLALRSQRVAAPEYGNLNCIPTDPPT